MVEKIAKLVKKQNSLKTKLNRFKEFLDTYIPANKIQLQKRIQSLETIITEFENVQHEILCLDETQYSEIETVEFENNYFKLVALAESLLNPCEASTVIPNTNTQVQSQPVGNSQSSFNVKLPDFNLPQFNGEYEKWVKFSDGFQSLIANNPALSKTQKFYYLQAALKGEAARVIENLEVTDENYETAWDLLRESYDNKKLILHSHLKSLFELDVVQRNSHTSLKRFVDVFSLNLRAIANQNDINTQLNAILIYLLTSKLDNFTKREWESFSKKNSQPTIEVFTDFLRDRGNLLLTLENKGVNSTPSTSRNTSNTKFVAHVATNDQSCPCCNDQHFIFQCKQFLSMNTKERHEQAKKLKLCLNCLRKGHDNLSCRSSKCKKCNKNHNTLLHFASFNQSNQRSPRNNTNTFVTQKDQESSDSESDSEVSPQVLSTYNNSTKIKEQYVLLSTAIIYIVDAHGNNIKCRALLDNGSQSNFLTRRLFKRLNLTGKDINIPIAGINRVATNINLKTKCTIKATHSDFETDLTFLIIDNITNNVPQKQINRNMLNIPQKYRLADPDFDKPAPIDILLGAGIFWNILLNNRVKLNNAEPILQDTVLGWIIAGAIPEHTAPILQCNMSQNLYKEVSDQIEKFWTVENSFNDSEMKYYTPEEVACEQHFKDNTSRDSNGRFIVSLPFKNNCTQLGESKSKAIKVLKSIERKFQTNAELHKQYREFMNEYIKLGHMKIVEDTSLSYLNYYLPHHAVLKENSITTKLRVVFNASAKTTNDAYLNDILMKGPQLQEDLLSIILRFRKYNIVLIADIEKMYRQILINKNDTKYQRIIWRDHIDVPLREYELQTVTYGTTPASYLATRCLKQLSLDIADTYPKESKIITKDFYMDDLLTGDKDLKSATKLKDNLQQILNSAGFNLRKWISNDNTILKNSANTPRDKNYIITDDKNVKTLGVSWNARSDIFYFTIDKVDNQPNSILTKRRLLSLIAKLYDPIGFIGPVIIVAKCLMQSVWKISLNWDDAVPRELQVVWLSLSQGFDYLNNLTIPRQIVLSNSKLVQLHGFSDASEKAYGACIYILSKGETGQISSKLICAKSRVAPLKTLSLPRLELCGGLLLANLTQKVISSLDMKIDTTYLWCDSTIVLSWIAGHPSKWKTFVGNRVSKIQELTGHASWRYVDSKNNPADIISRGCTPEKLVNLTQWWHGPPYLLLEEKEWPKNILNPNETCELKTPQLITLHTTELDFSLFNRYSNYTKLLRITSYCLRFINRLKARTQLTFPEKITNGELQESEARLVKLVQNIEFGTEINNLKKSKSVSSKSRLISLNPFLDNNDIIRVGGRLRHAKLNYDKRFPIILPSNHAFTKLIIQHEHLKQLHSGPQFILSTVRQRFWPLKGRQTVRSVLKKCVTCFRIRPQSVYPIMGNLPYYRVNPSRPFLLTGCDFAGPYLLKDGKLRNRRLVKTYFCIFVCLSTKAVHIEPVGDLSSDGFLNCLKRFVSRRGLCTKLFSDNATNFIGSNRVIGRLSDFTTEQSFNTYLQENRIEWKFIPANSPHFGGIWEAAVKSAKSHLKAVLHDTPLIYEEFHTLLAQVEAILNSRPLVPLSNDPEDLDPLTPGHFLIGGPLNAVPQEEFGQIGKNRLTRYKHLQQMIQHFWKRWSRSYLNTLQERGKWKTNSKTLSVGALVVIKDDNLHPQQWKMGSILQLHPGPDDVVRVVTLKTTSGEVTRAVSRICVLPIDA